MDGQLPAEIENFPGNLGHTCVDFKMGKLTGFTGILLFIEKSIRLFFFISWITFPVAL